MHLTSQPLGLSATSLQAQPWSCSRKHFWGCTPLPSGWGALPVSTALGPTTLGPPDPQPLCPQPGWADSPQIPSTEQMSLPTPLVTLPTTPKVLR